MLSSITTPSTLTDSFGLNSNAINPDRLSSTQSQVLVEKKKKKKKKRAREDDEATATEAVDADGLKKKRKRKHSDLPEPEIATRAEVATLEPAPSSKPKKKKKDKGKSKDTKLTEQTDAQIEADSQASAAALLSAIVAVSVTSPEAPQISPPYDPQMQPSPSDEFMYPPMQYGYPPGPYDPNAAQPQNIFAAAIGPAGGGAFSELAFGSNEDLLRALQDLDMSKIASVLKTLGDAAGAPTAAPQLSFLPTQLDQFLPPPLTRHQSNAILGVPPKQSSTNTGHRRTINMNLPGNEQHTNPDHAHLLANKWLGANKLAELVRVEGLLYKKGKFSAIEEEQLRAAIEKYQHEKGLTPAQIQETIFSKTDKSKDTAFWSELTSAVPLRPIIAVYHHVRRSYHPMKQQGAWQSHEDAALKQAVADLGQQWEKVSHRVGRMASDCRDRYRNHIVNSDIRVTGHWTPEEEEKLTRIVTDMTIKQGRDIDNDVFWGKVSELMGGTRGRQQCRIKWTDALSKTVKNEGKKPRWSPQDAFILVHKVDSLNVRDDTEIDWKLIPDPDWNLWSAHTLQRRWLTLKKGVRGYEDMTHQEIMDILRIKKADLPPLAVPSMRRKKERKVTSAAAVNESPDSRASDDSPAAAGSSTGPGTSATQAHDDDSTDSDS